MNVPTVDRDYCASSFLAFRYVVRQDVAWADGLKPFSTRSGTSSHATTAVDGPDDILRTLRARLSHLDPARLGLLLSGGIDSAILAAVFPKQVKAYTIAFEGADDESEIERARAFADHAQLQHEVVKVSWAQYESLVDDLMLDKRSPLHAIEPALAIAALHARSQGIRDLVVGNGADSTFGGMDKLLSRDWSLEEFINRYQFVDPAHVLRTSVDVSDTFRSYQTDAGSIDVQGFLKTVHGEGIVDSFVNGITFGRCSVIAPYESMHLARPLDMLRIRNGEPKYDLQAVFEHLFPGLHAPQKVPFARPMDRWMSSWSGPTHQAFVDNAVQGLNGEQKWLVYVLDRWLHMVDDAEA